MGTSGTKSVSVPASREVEAMLWRAALSLGADEARADDALALVHQHTARPDHASESRMLGIVIEHVHGGWAVPMGSTDWAAKDSLAWRLVRVGGVPVDVAANVLGVSEEDVASECARGDAEAPADWARGVRDGVAGADVAAALARVDALTAGLRRRRLALNVLKFAAFVFVLGLVVFVMFDLREAARKEKAGLTPGDLYSLPMPKEK